MYGLSDTEVLPDRDVGGFWHLTPRSLYGLRYTPYLCESEREIHASFYNLAKCRFSFSLWRAEEANAMIAN